MSEPRILTRERFPSLLDALRREGYRLIGPTVRDGAIVYAEIAGAADLPAGWTDVQAPGRYRLERRPDEALFGYAVGPHSWKATFFVPRLRLWQATRQSDGFEVETEADLPCRVALIGARGCDLAAIGIQDRVFLGGPCTEPDYARRRNDVFVVAVNCGVAGGTCFCVSMGTGPGVAQGYDLALTELIDAGGHRFVVEVGSAAGAAILTALDTIPADQAERVRAADVVAGTATRMGRQLDTAGIRELLADTLEHPRWDEVASRCLGCTNCTLVCPTCFCAQVEDVTDLAGDHAERIRSWDSCFTLDHSHLSAGPVRPTIRGRYRQWLTHKLGTWIDQFGTSGCVGCGRCITWCPVGIDITEEVAALRGPLPAAAEEAR